MNPAQTTSRYLCRPSATSIILTAAVAFGALVISATSGTAQDAEEKPAYQVIVHSSNRLSSLDRKQIAAYFMEARQAWPNGTLTEPINLQPESEIRAAFSEDVIKLSIEKVRANWRRLLFQGKGLPPPERATEGEILDYVGDRPNAIGYIATGTELGDQVKVLSVTDD